MTYILLDLLEQQAQRKKELVDTLVCLELQKEGEQQDFWLLQYQKLLDAQPSELSLKSSTIDPMLGYNFLINDVVHCIPFLSKLWQSHAYNIEDITDDNLIAAGIQKPADRSKIIKSIADFVRQQQQQRHTESELATQYKHGERSAASKPTAPREQAASDAAETCNDLSSECVICMEETVSVLAPIFTYIAWLRACRVTQHIYTISSFIYDSVRFFLFFLLSRDHLQCMVILLPCGHLCCCVNCQNSIDLCPLCRAQIERRIKIIQA